MNNAELHAASALAQLPNLIQEQTKVLRDIATALAHLAIVQHAENLGNYCTLDAGIVADIRNKGKEAAK